MVQGRFCTVGNKILPQPPLADRMSVPHDGQKRAKLSTLAPHAVQNLPLSSVGAAVASCTHVCD